MMTTAQEEEGELIGRQHGYSMNPREGGKQITQTSDSTKWSKMICDESSIWQGGVYCTQAPETVPKIVNKNCMHSCIE
jgi:hypothetical protein